MALFGRRRVCIVNASSPAGKRRVASRLMPLHGRRTLSKSKATYLNNCTSRTSRRDWKLREARLVFATTPQHLPTYLSSSVLRGNYQRSEKTLSSGVNTQKRGGLRWGFVDPRGMQRVHAATSRKYDRLFLCVEYRNCPVTHRSDDSVIPNACVE